MNTYQNLTWDDLKAMIAEVTKQMEESKQRMEKMNAETTQQMKESKQRMDEMNAEADLRFEKFRAEMEKDRKELDRQIGGMAKELNRQIGDMSKSYGDMAKDLNRQIGGMSKSNGDMAEEFFFNAFRRDKIFMNEKYDQIHKGYFYSIDDIRNEFDIVFINGKSIAIVEVKYKAKPENIDIEHLISRAERFKKFSPIYKNHNIYIGVAAMSFKKGLASDLHQAGIVTVHPVGKKMVIYDKEAKVF